MISGDLEIMILEILHLDKTILFDLYSANWIIFPLRIYGKPPNKMGVFKI